MRISRPFRRIAAGKSRRTAAEKPSRDGSFIVAALIVLGLVFAGPWIVTYVKHSNPWALTAWCGVVAALIVVFGRFTSLCHGGDGGNR